MSEGRGDERKIPWKIQHCETASNFWQDLKCTMKELMVLCFFASLASTIRERNAQKQVIVLAKTCSSSCWFKIYGIIWYLGSMSMYCRWWVTPGQHKINFFYAYRCNLVKLEQSVTGQPISIATSHATSWSWACASLPQQLVGCLSLALLPELEKLTLAAGSSVTSVKNKDR